MSCSLVWMSFSLVFSFLLQVNARHVSFALALMELIDLYIALGRTLQRALALQRTTFLCNTLYRT